MNLPQTLEANAERKDLDTAMARIRLLAYAILDGTPTPIDRVADQKPCYSGKHKRHRVNVQVIADAAGRSSGRHPPCRARRTTSPPPAPTASSIP